jgi:DNA-binding NarL/FixJ family response regulator
MILKTSIQVFNSYIAEQVSTAVCLAFIRLILSSNRELTPAILEILSAVYSVLPGEC